MQESPVFTRTHDLLRWLLDTTRKFPREQRFVLAQRLHQQAFALQDALTAAGLDSRSAARHLLDADIALSGLRKTLQLSHELGLLDDGPYRHASQMAMEVGRLLGGWRKKAGT
jgi:hypothetical protein